MPSFENSQLKDLTKGRTRNELGPLKDRLLIVASNMYSDGKISNSDYNDICGALVKIRDILDNSEACKK